MCFNLGETIDNFNNEHRDFLKEYFISKNKQKLPFSFKYLTYKEGIDILTESRPYDLALDLLNEGYRVYCLDDTIKERLDERIIFNTPDEEVYSIDI